VRRSSVAVLGGLAALTALRLWWCGRFELSPDEAYYALWSERLDLAYYSKGPGVALALRASTELLGRHEIGVRALSPLLALGTTLLLFVLVRRMSGRGVALGSAVVLNVLPLFNVGALLMTIDPLSTCAWTAGLLCAWRAIERSPSFSWWWPACGLSIGAGFLAKYTNVAQLVGLAVVLGITPSLRRELVRPGFLSCLGVFAACAVPPVAWNARHDWITLRHLGERGGLAEPFGLRPAEALEFAGAHLGVYSPILFVLLLAALPGAWRAARTDLAARFLLALGLPLVVTYALLSFRQAGEANWTGPGFLTLLPLAVRHWMPRAVASRRVRAWITAGIALGALLSLAIANTDLVRAAGVALPARLDPSARLRGWREAATGVARTHARLEARLGAPVQVVANRYAVASELAFYGVRGGSDDPPVKVVRRVQPKDQFWFWPGLDPTRAALYVTDARAPELPRTLLEDLGACSELEPVRVEHAGDEVRSLRLYSCAGRGD
jgi:4-amino-4-deoxy-L-arabinose transferase-like glycosyltransferase